MKTNILFNSSQQALGAATRILVLRSKIVICYSKIFMCFVAKPSNKCI